MDNALIGRGKLKLTFEPDQVQGEEKQPNISVEGQGYLEFEVIKELPPFLDPEISLRAVLNQPIIREYRFSLKPPTGPLTLKLVDAEKGSK